MPHWRRCFRALRALYNVSVELTGFKRARRDQAEIRVGDRVQLDFMLEPGGVSEEVQVIAKSPLLETGTATMGQVIDSKLIQEIPLATARRTGSRVWWPAPRSSGRKSCRTTRSKASRTRWQRLARPDQREFREDEQHRFEHGHEAARYSAWSEGQL